MKRLGNLCRPGTPCIQAPRLAFGAKARAELLSLGADAVVERTSGPLAVAALIEAVAGFAGPARAAA